MINQSDLDNAFQLAVKNKTSVSYIVDNFDYYDAIISSDSLKQAIKTINKHKNVIHLNNKDIAKIYISKKGINKIDSSLICDIFDIDIADIRELETSDDVTDIKDNIESFKRLTDKYNKLNKKLESMLPLTNEIIEMIDVKNFNMYNLNDEQIDISMINECFNVLEPTENIKIIIMCNSSGENIYKVNPNIPITNHGIILNTVNKNNTINLFYETDKKTTSDVKKAVLDFEDGMCNVRIPVDKKNDDTLYFIKTLIKKYIKLVDVNSNNTISGKLDIKVIEQPNYYSFYEFMMTNEFAKSLFIVNESNDPWCSTKRYFKIIYIDPVCNIFKDLTSVKEFPYVEIKVPSSVVYEGKCIFRFTTRYLDLVPKMTDIFCKVISLFSNKSKQTINNKYKEAFLSTVLASFKIKSLGLTETTKAYRSSSLSYTSKCQGNPQPIIIDDIDIKDYESLDKHVEIYNFNGKNLNFVCMNDNLSNFKYLNVEIPLKDENGIFPCCQKTSNKKQTTTKINKASSSKEMSALKQYGNTSNLELSDLTDFIRHSYNKKLNCNAFLVGTCFPKGENKTINNSFIGALILSQKPGNITYEQPVDNKDFDIICEDVRRRMIELPYEIYAQELYDVPYETFVDNVLNPDHSIEPYLYYRGLEELFNVNIFTFTSKVKNRKYPSTIEESQIETTTLEIPRCKEYHTRRLNKDRDIVIIFKNYGADRTKRVISSFELVCVSDKKTEEDLIYSFSSTNTRFQEKVFEYFKKCCTPLTFNYSESNIVTYKDIFSDWDADKLGFGKVKGQELNDYGKAELLIYKEWNVIIPPIQPLFLRKQLPEADNTIYDGNDIFFEKDVRVYERAKLKSLKECLETFEVTEVDKSGDGVWIEFQGNKRGLKILCENHQHKSIHYSEIDQRITDKNNFYAFYQLLIWLWKSEYTKEKGLPTIKKWISDKIDKSMKDSEVERPTIHLNNHYLPSLNSFDERIKYCHKIWPFFFSKDKIKMTESLYLRIMNLLEEQDKYTRFLNPENYYGKIPTFIKNLIPVKGDYDSFDSVVFTNIENLKHWINYTNRSIVSHISLTNMNVINEKIYDSLSLQLNPYFFKNSNGKIFLIQNVHDNTDKSSCALEIAYKWEKTGENIGPFVGSRNFSKTNKIDFIIFKVDDSKNVVPSISKSKSTTEYLRILNYKNGSYAAMLPVL